MKNIIIVTGGSLGHISPGISICDLLINKYNIYWILDNKKDIKYFINYNKKIKFIILNKKNIYNKIRVLEIFLNILCFILYIYNCIKIILYIKPIFVIGLGNYMSIIICILSWIFKIPIIIHEQNSILGKSNYIINFLSFKTIKSIGYNNFYDKNLIFIKNPIRKEFLNFKYNKKNINFNKKYTNILIIGGSKGSNFINYNVINNIKISNNKLIWHQIGNYENLNKLINFYEKFNLLNCIYKIENFINNISKAYYWADFIISRSGAMSISEIMYTKIPSILIPLKTIDNHQYYNTIFLYKNNFAKVIYQDDVNFNYNINYYIELFSNKKYLYNIHKKMKKSINYNIKSINKKILIELNYNEFKYI